MRGSRLVITMILVLPTACARSTSPTSSTTRARSDVPVAVLPAVWATRRADAPVDASAVVARALGRTVHVRTLSADRTERTLASEPDGCAADVACVQRVGRRLQANAVVLVELAELGGTVLVRASAVDVRLGTRRAIQQEVVHDARPARLTAALDRVGGEVGRPLAPSRQRPAPPRPFWQRGVFWIAAGVVVAGAATAVAVAASSGSDEPQPDVTVVPP